MPVLPTTLYRAAQSRELDRIAIAQGGVTGLELMQRAGAAAWEYLKRRWPAARSITVTCGGGNNGGDGYVLGRLAHEEGREVRLYAAVAPEQLKGDALSAAREFLATRAGVHSALSPGLLESDVVVDCLLGTGLDRPVAGTLGNVIEALNECRRDILAVDLPSGLNADTGSVMGLAVRARATITFLGMKQGLLTGAGPDYAGAIAFSDLGIAPSLFSGVAPASRRMDWQLLRELAGHRRPAAHKGDFGHVLVVGGDQGFPGSVHLAAEAAARAGAGLVSVATRTEHVMAIAAARPEIMSRGVAAAADLNPLLERATVIAVGPGLGQGAWGAALFARLLDTKLPMVVDADALRLLAADPVRRDNWILTPHPGEAAALLGIDTAAIQGDRFAAVAALREKYGGCAVLKGAGTLVADEHGLHLCSDGNPGLASGGTGDVLTGVIAAQLAQGHEPGIAAKLGVCLHAAAADHAAEEGMRGMLARDLMPWLRRLSNALP